MCCVLNDLYPKALIYQLNLSHFETLKNYQEDSDDSLELITEFKQCTADSYCLFGKQLIFNYLEHIKLN